MQESSVQVSSVKGEAQTWEAHSSALFSMNSELLDLLQATQDSSLEADSANPIPQTPSPSPRISPPRLVVGGSLFPRYAGAASARNPMTMKICERVRLAAPPRSSHFPLGGYRLGLLRFGTLYCPFTKQFFSLSSMHWSCLRAAGFDVDISMYCGRSVRLLNPVQLYRMACELHNSTPVWKKETPGFPLHCPVAPDPPKPLPILQAKKFYHQQAWSNLLASTLGKLLESAATSDFHRFCQSISASVELESDPFTSRRIQFTHDWLLSMHSTTSASTEAPRNLPTGAMSEYTTISAAMAREQCGWRSEVLQLRPKWIPTVEADRTSPLSDGSSLGEAAASSSPCVESWIRPFVHRPLLQLLPGLPSHTRAVQLFVQASHDGDVQVVCECVLGNLVRQARCHSHPPTIYTCPVHHCVDYSTVLDLVAFPVVDTGQHLDATPHHKLISERRLDTSTSVPLLSLGLPSSNTSVEDAKFFVDVRPPECVVVIENAHFFSRRAISRLLDQWTRNGAAWQIVMEGCCDPQQTASSDGASSHSISTFRQLLLGVEPITKSVRLRHGHPLGRVQVVLVGLSMSQVSSSSTPEGDADRWVEVAHASGEMTVELNSGPCQSRFFVEEPLSATLLRLAPMYARKMTGVARTEVRQEIVEAAIALLPNTLHLQQTHSRLLRSGKKEYSGSEGVPLHSLAGEALLSEACEQLLQLGDSADGCPKMDSSMEGTGRYPFLNTLRVRHALLNGHYMRVRRSLSSPSDPPRHGRAEPVNRQVLQVDFCDSRQEWMDRHEQQLGELARCAWAEQRCMWQGKHSTPSVQSDFREAYHPFLEPPLLLGQWTSTLLFCAPAVADVLPLRAILLDALRRQQPPDGWETDCVDIMHVDSVVFPSERRCRLFGVRARFADTSDFTMLAKAACEKALQRVLKAYAATQSLFSLWTYRLASSNEVARERLGDVVASLGEGSRLRILPASTTDFSAVTEWKSPLVPNTVEKRLFSLAMFQQPPLQVAVGSRVVLRSAQHLQRHDSRPGMSMTGAVRPSPETSQPIVVSRGTICTVVRLVAHNELQKQETGLMASAAQPTSAHRDYAQLYAEQQPQGTCRFPLLETMTTDGKMVRFILLPEPTIVGGYMSLHFYGLPLLHLPMHVLLSSTSERAGIHRRSRLNHGGETQASTRACVCSTAVFHPFSTHPDSLSAITFTEKDYLAAFDRLRKRTSQLESTDDPDDHTLYSFVEDVVFENDRPFAEGEVNARDETSAVFTSSALTELSLFPRMGVSYTQAHPLSTSSTEGE